MQTEEAEPQQEEKVDMQKLDGKERIALLKKRKEDMKAKMEMRKKASAQVADES